ncbi:hypothetical protein BLNAU_5011 [Blattamonas nauphoetae]|uniref:Uncharacterized protein n=1 Tax=Blattamonas nauphoetae TaxID=2049346 RepID=A0ABQ9Y8W2_9EUKA|nr:hypothetical protein BLNAU_5011 [Blattamonas nauphoetae]
MMMFTEANLIQEETTVTETKNRGSGGSKLSSITQLSSGQPHSSRRMCVSTHAPSSQTVSHLHSGCPVEWAMQTTRWCSLSSPQSSPQRLSQRLLSSSLDICADSLSGTARMDINRGGNLVCQNTSFTRSKRTEPAHSYQHHIQQKEPEETSLSFFLCTFKDIPSNGRGGGLKSSVANADLKPSHCSFQSVPTNFDGGGIAVYPGTQYGSFTLLECCFEGCEARIGHRFHKLTTVTSDRIDTDQLCFHIR